MYLTFIVILLRTDVSIYALHTLLFPILLFVFVTLLVFLRNLWHKKKLDGIRSQRTLSTSQRYASALLLPPIT